MGCIKSKDKDEYSDVKPIDLDTREIFRLKKSWKGIQREMETAGVEMIFRLFDENVYIKEYFVTLTKAQDKKLKEAILKHALDSMELFDECIMNIDNSVYIMNITKNTGQVHFEFPKFRRNYLWCMREPFLEAVRMTLDERYTESIEKLYKTVIDYILETMSGIPKDHESYHEKESKICCETVQNTFDLKLESDETASKIQSSESETSTSKVYS